MNSNINLQSISNSDNEDVNKLTKSNLKMLENDKKHDRGKS